MESNPFIANRGRSPLQPVRTRLESSVVLDVNTHKKIKAVILKKLYS